MAKKKAVRPKGTKKNGTVARTKKKKAAPKPPVSAEVPSKEMRHYEEIVALNSEVCQAYRELEDSRSHTKALKEIYTSKCAALSVLISEGPDPQLVLPFAESAKPGSTAPPAAWMVRPLGVLGLAPALTSRLENNGLETLGQLDAFWKEGKLLTSIRGIAAEKAAAVADAYAQYGKDHPEIYGLESDAPAEDDDDDFDSP